MSVYQKSPFLSLVLARLSLLKHVLATVVVSFFINLGKHICLPTYKKLKNKMNWDFGVFFPSFLPISTAGMQ